MCVCMCLCRLIFFFQENCVDLIELPRLRLSLTEKEGQLYSIDHSDLKICDEKFVFYIHIYP